MKEQMREVFEALYKPQKNDFNIFNRGDDEEYLNPNTDKSYKGFILGYQAALSAVQANHIPDVGNMVQSQEKPAEYEDLSGYPKPSLKSQAQQPAQMPEKLDHSLIVKLAREAGVNTEPDIMVVMSKFAELVQSQAQQPVKRNAILLNSIAEAARCLGVAQAKEDKDAIEHFNKVVDDLVLSQQPAQEPVKQDPEPFQLPENGAVLNILGRPNFACGGLARQLRKLGHSIPTKAEDEQAHVLFWMLNLYLKHGENWAQVGEEYLATPPAPEGGNK